MSEPSRGRTEGRLGPGPIAALLLGLALTAHAGDNLDANGENACDDLGPACLCAESLDVSEVVPPFWDPSNSTSRDCDLCFESDESTGMTLVPEDGMPPGNTVDHVLRLDAQGTSVYSLRTAEPEAYTEGTVCLRQYHRFSPDLDYTQVEDNGRAQRVKLAEINITPLGGSVGSQCLFQGGILPAEGGIVFSLFGLAGCQGNLDAVDTGDVSLADCTSSWCRLEMCVTLHNGIYTPRGRAVVVNTGETNRYVWQGPPMQMDMVSFSNAFDADHIWLGDLYFQNVPRGHRLASYGMSAFWATAQDDSQWIGPALEVEVGPDSDGDGWIDSLDRCDVVDAFRGGDDDALVGGWESTLRDDLDLDGIPTCMDLCPFHAEQDPTADEDQDGRGDECQCGDITGNGRVDVSDIVAMIVSIFDPQIAPPLCDTTGDGVCDVTDIIEVNREIFSVGPTARCSRSPYPNL